MKNGQSQALALVRMLELLHLSANQALCSAWLKFLSENSDHGLAQTTHFQTTTPSPPRLHHHTRSPSCPHHDSGGRGEGRGRVGKEGGQNGGCEGRGACLPPAHHTDVTPLLPRLHHLPPPPLPPLLLFADE